MDNLFDENFKLKNCHSYDPKDMIRLFKAKLRESDWVITRHYEEVLCGQDTTISDSQFKIFRENRQKLRNKINELEV